jgi:hypothetical protein
MADFTSAMQNGKANTQKNGRERKLNGITFYRISNKSCAATGGLTRFPLSIQRIRKGSCQ